MTEQGLLNLVGHGDPTIGIMTHSNVFHRFYAWASSSVAVSLLACLDTFSVSRKTTLARSETL